MVSFRPPGKKKIVSPASQQVEPSLFRNEQFHFSRINVLVLLVFGHLHLHLNFFVLFVLAMGGGGLEGGVGRGGRRGHFTGGAGKAGLRLFLVVVDLFFVFGVADGLVAGMGQLAMATHGLRINEGLFAKVASVGSFARVP